MNLPVMTKENMVFLKELTEAVLEASLVRPGQDLPGSGPNRLGFTFVRPGGRKCYPAFWTRDYVMSLESGLIPDKIARDSFACLAQYQAKEELHFKSGAVVPKGAIPDHICPNGQPIYFPGTYDYETQGGEKYGMRPPYDGNFFFIENAFLTPGIPFSVYQEQLEEAFWMVPVEKEGFLVECTKQNRGANFGFTDAVVHTGKLLMSSLLRGLAARRLAALFEKAGNCEKSETYKCLSRKISARIEEVFFSDCGFLKASTGCSGQPDVWGSAFAVYSELLSRNCSVRISEAMAGELREGGIAWKGQIRHIPLKYDARPDSPWENTPVAKNRYENGAYWGTPVGWVACTVSLTDPDSANRLLEEYMDYLREYDFRKGPEYHAPWECIHPDGDYHNNAVYLTSVICPYAAMLKMQKM